ncbi:L-Aspartase-like protein [Xylaria arbuscula]|nr:L-Aspartase-like protein [Xylaria arbuscula]
MPSQINCFKNLVLAQSRDPSLSANTALPINGRELTIALTPDSISAIDVCSRVIPKRLAKGDHIYGINTGFGGSSDTRSNDVKGIQQSLISRQTCGIVSNGKQKPIQDRNGHASESKGETNGTRSSLPLNDPLSATCIPESLARASMVTRLNSLTGGASGICVSIAECLTKLLNEDIVPRIPMRGSISASGDLSALAWISALMEGKSYATAIAGPRDIEGARKVIRADRAPSEASIEPISLQAKEGLAIIDGTAVSAGVVALAMYESLNLQVLKAMSVEALRGSDESFESFIARVRPHSGQADSARSIKAFLTSSQLLNKHDSQNEETLRQDRYSLQDFCLSHDQLAIDAETRRVFHGGNFQARAETSAVEKLRQGLQSIGRMLFNQCTEMMNLATNRGLPSHLCSDDLNTSFLFKGMDILSVDVLWQIAATHLLALCQAFDLRAIEIDGRADASPDATPHIGAASRGMYHFIRKDLGVPFLGEDYLASTESGTLDGITPSMGLYNTRGYESIRSGRLYDVVLECFEEVEELEGQEEWLQCA